MAPLHLIILALYKMELDKYINAFHEVIKEVLSQMDLETAKLFVERFKEKLDEQKRTQENSRTS